MIIKSEADVTTAVLAEVARAEDPRLAEILSSMVRHLHAFARDVNLTEAEFQMALSYLAAVGQHTTESHNEAVLLAGSLGLSSLVCLLNNGDQGRSETTANLLGPFWRMHSPSMQNGESIVRSPTPGSALFATLTVKDRDGRAVEDAEVDVWQASPEGFYENQDPEQADMNLRGKFITDAQGRFSFQSVMPAGYPIPVNGPAGQLMRVLKRHNMRPAHIHFMVFKPGFKTHVSQVYVRGDPVALSDVQFGVTERLLGDFVRHEGGRPMGFATADVPSVWHSLDFTLVIEAGEAKLPRAPISGRATGGRPEIERLKRA